MTLKRGDWVTASGSAAIGRVKRLACDGSWVDVNWHTHTKRMQSAHLAIQHTIPFRPLGLGWIMTDETRRAELEQKVQA